MEYKNYNIQIKGRVQDIGFRDFVESIARSLNIKGMVYNAPDGTVKVVCGGAVSSIKSFIKELKSKSANVGATIDEINQVEIRDAVEFPPIFFKAPTDELGDIGRKLDVGVGYLRKLSDGQDRLIDGQDKITDGQDKLIEGQDALVGGQERIIGGQDTLISGQDRMISILEKIANK